MSYNSIYGKFRLPTLVDEGLSNEWWNGDVQVPESAVPLHQEQYRSQNGRDLPICRSCFYGVHPHKIRKDPGRIETDSQDCKVVLHNEDGAPTGNQCCCTWSEVKR